MNIRNFCIIAHIDHGKTTLTDRLLEATGTISMGGLARLMDSNPIEQERGITIKLAPVRMLYTPKKNKPPHLKITDSEYILNLIDTPGHVDFAYEVSRSLKACEGAILVIDATKGIQAQTIANHSAAVAEGLTIIPVINKIDLDAADVNKVIREITTIFGYSGEKILLVSAKTGVGVSQLLDAIVARIPAPAPSSQHTKSHTGCVIPSPLRAFIFNSIYDPHKGVIAFIKVVGGKINPSNFHHLLLWANQEELSPLELGFFAPDMRKTDHLGTGEVGYIATGHKDIRLVTIGDTLTTRGQKITPISGYQRPQPMVYMDLYPVDTLDYRSLVDALAKLALNDAALVYHSTASSALGHGFRVGFLGILHAEIVSERLSREFEVDVINTSPSVPYQLTLKNGQVKEFSSPSEFPKPETINAIKEPMVTLAIYSPETYLGGIMELCQGKRAKFLDMQYLAGGVRLGYSMPLVELITNFYDSLKSTTSGYASVQYSHSGYQTVDAVKVDILLNNDLAEALSFIAPRTLAESRGRVLVEKLKEVIPRSQIEVAIQAAIGGKIIARSTIKAYRKDVTAKLHGGDMTRNRKLLEKQKKGKKKMKQLGNVSVPKEAFTEILKI